MGSSGFASCTTPRAVMGIQGLLPILRPVIEDAHVREFKGKTLGIDTFAWLHKAAFTCAYELGMNIKTDK